MANYYGVQRSEEYLAHYGIKGMRWGVQKAKVAGNDKQLAKHFMKAQKKLEKLNRRADVNYQTNKLKEQKDKAKISAIDTSIAGIHSGVMLSNGVLPYIGLGAAAQGIGRTAYHLGRAAYHKRKASASGTVKAKMKRDRWQSEMNKAFAGTKYASRGNRQGKKRKR